MKQFLVICAVIVMAIAAAWGVAKAQAIQREKKALQYAAAPGRVTYVPLEAIFAEPTKHNGKRIILAGILSAGFESSFLDSGKNTENFDIWVNVDWEKVDEKMGDFSRRKEPNEEQTDVLPYIESFKIVAEGTFFYREKGGFGHLGGSKGLFTIDRVYRWDPVKEEESTKPRNEPFQSQAGCSTEKKQKHEVRATRPYPQTSARPAVAPYPQSTTNCLPEAQKRRHRRLRWMQCTADESGDALSAIVFQRVIFAQPNCRLESVTQSTPDAWRSHATSDPAPRWRFPRNAPHFSA